MSTEPLPPSLDAVDDLVLVVDEDGDLLAWNGSVVEVTGHAESALASMEAEDLLEGDGRKRLREVASDLPEGERESVEAAVETADGSTVPYEFECGVPAGEESRRLVAIGRDVADHRKRETALEELHRVAGAIQDEGSLEAACERTVRAAANILEFEMCSILLREDDWLVPYASSEAAPPDGTRPMRLDQGLAGKTYRTGESHVVDEVPTDETSDPAKESYRSGLSVPVGEHGVFQAVETEVGAFDDTDVMLAELLALHTATAIDRIERERELEAANSRLEEFTGIVSHDLRNPLNVAEGYLELEMADRESDALDAVARAHDRMRTLVDDLLTVARQGASDPDAETVDLADVATDAWAGVRTGEATLEVETERTVRADPSRLRQLLENLFRNSVEHGGEDVTVTLGDLPDGFYVADDGPGIPEGERERVFEAGYSTAEEGTGFGLRIVRAIADVHDWEVEVTASADGGARFEVTGLDTE